MCAVFDYTPIDVVQIQRCQSVPWGKRNQTNLTSWRPFKTVDLVSCSYKIKRGSSVVDCFIHSANLCWSACLCYTLLLIILRQRHSCLYEVCNLMEEVRYIKEVQWRYRCFHRAPCRPLLGYIGKVGNALKDDREALRGILSIGF